MSPLTVDGVVAIAIVPFAGDAGRGIIDGGDGGAEVGNGGGEGGGSADDSGAAGGLMVDA